MAFAVSRQNKEKMEINNHRGFLKPEAMAIIGAIFLVIFLGNNFLVGAQTQFLQSLADHCVKGYSDMSLSCEQERWGNIAYPEVTSENKRINIPDLGMPKIFAGMQTSRDGIVDCINTIPSGNEEINQVVEKVCLSKSLYFSAKLYNQELNSINNFEKDHPGLTLDNHVLDEKKETYAKFLELSKQPKRDWTVTWKIGKRGKLEGTPTMFSRSILPLNNPSVTEVIHDEKNGSHYAYTFNYNSYVNPWIAKLQH